ncbi:hypothetical protein B7802_25345 [Salmonella enterica]|nr:hypothetical protein [Salmonella enterica subsp. diarizonae]EAP0946294.1 hypothetical protein [Salmonella enterica]EBD5985019.1 hypothetical protein [Salmonella enterica]EBI4325062.1 hypothetical protein [Salmonella enterica]ECC1581021.1 hypothetical protein [Salmonella enterica subsp. diarizonae]
MINIVKFQFKKIVDMPIRMPMIFFSVKTPSSKQFKGPLKMRSSGLLNDGFFVWRWYVVLSVADFFGRRPKSKTAK